MVPGMGEAGPPLLRITLDGREIAAFGRRRELTAAAELKGAGPELVFHDAQGGRITFDLSPLLPDGFPWIHFSLRISPAFGVQADALLGPSVNPPLESFARLQTPGVRLQPFLLPENGGGNGRFQGRGLMARGFHHSGAVTPGNVSLLCLCDACGRTFRLQSFHAGSANLAYFYCSGGLHTLVMSGFDEDAPPLLREPDPVMLDRLHMRLPPCERCGGAFRYSHPLRCPHCAAPYIDFGRFPAERAAEYYGNTLFGETAQQVPS